MEKNVGKMSKNLVKAIILGAVALLLAVAMIVSNYYVNYYALIINRFLVGDTADSTSTDAQGALAAADKVVRSSAEESIVLLKNDTVGGKSCLPKPDLKKVNLFGWGDRKSVV